MSELVLEALAGIIDVLLLGCAIGILASRVRDGQMRARQAALVIEQQCRQARSRADQLGRAIQENEAMIAAEERRLKELEEEIAVLTKNLDATELPFNYTVIPPGSGDLHARAWRFLVCNPGLACRSAESEPAARWREGRYYLVAAGNQSESRSIMDRSLLQRHGFTITALSDGLAYNAAIQ